MKPEPRYQPGDKIGGRYQVHQALMGGMGEVYLCLDLETKLPFALKTFQQRFLTNTKLRAAFENEVATWVALEKHPNIVRCFYMDALDNQPFMVLEWIAGEEGRGTDLRSWLRRGSLDLRLALDFTIDICRGLIHAQEKQPGLVHRDLKPENILIAPGGLAKITDFGLAQIVQTAELEVTTGAGGETEGRQSLLGVGGNVGTPPYMAPEQWRGEVLDARTDIYAIGCVLYEMLAGSRPFQARELDDLRRQHLESDIPRLVGDRVKPDLLNTLLSHCLSKRRRERFADVNDLLEQLVLLYEQLFAELPKTAIIAGGNEFPAADYNNRGVTYHSLQRYDEALADYNRAIQLAPTLALAYVNRGATYHELRYYEKALADHSTAVQLDPRFAMAYSSRGYTLGIVQRFAEAIADHNKAIQLDNINPTIFAHRGSTYEEMGRFDEAIADYTKTLQLDPTYKVAYNDRGFIYARLQRYEEALADLDEATKLDPTFAVAYHNRAYVHAEMQRYEEALADYTNTIKHDPGNANAYFSRGSVYVTLKRYQEAFIDFAKADQLGHPQAVDTVKRLKKEIEVVCAGLYFSFLIAESCEEVRRLAERFPIMTTPSAVEFFEQFQKGSQNLSPKLKNRLAWLRQIADEQKREE
jgi:serine/threonine protein kinase